LRKAWCFPFLIVFALQGLFATSPVQADDPNWPTLRVPDASTSVPAMFQDAPFELASNFAIADENNREQIYLRLHLMCGDYSKAERYTQEDLSPSQARRLGAMIGKRGRSVAAWRHYYDKLERKDFSAISQQRQLLDFYRQNPNVKDQPKPKLRDLERAIRFGKKLDWLFEGLSEAKQRKQCFFHSFNLDRGEFAQVGISHHTVLTIIGDVLALRYIVTDDLETTINELADTLLYCSDVRRAIQVHSDAGAGTETECYEKVVRPLLHDQRLTVDNIDHLITSLVAHRDRNQEMDSVIDVAKYNYIKRRHTYEKLKRGKYVAIRTRSDAHIPMRPGETLHSQLSHLLDSFGQSKFANGDQLRNAPPQVVEDWNNSDIHPRAVKQLITLSEQAQAGDGAYRSSEHFRIACANVRASIIGDMDANDYDTDLKLLDQRYREIEAACNKPYPESTKALTYLSRNWTNDDTWKKSPILLLHWPRVLPSRAKRVLHTNAWLCLAAIRKWQLEHDEENPSDLTEALNAAKIRTPVVDPYSGKQLIMRQFNKKVMIYSVGPDGVDTQGKQVLRRSRQSGFLAAFANSSTTSGQKGDVCFELWISNGNRSR